MSLSDVHVLTIALPGSYRYASLKQSLDELGIAPSQIDAVDGRALSADELAGVADLDAGRLLYGHALTPTQVGCHLSHRKAYSRFLAGRSHWALILEDDACLLPGLIETVNEIQSMPLHGPTVVQLYSEGRLAVGRESLALASGVTLRRLRTFPGFTVGYLVNRAAAQQALAHGGPVASRADWPPWAVEIDFWRVVPNVVAHGRPGLEEPSTMMTPSDTESAWAKAIRWLGLATGATYLRLRSQYPGGLRQFYRHAVRPSALYWGSRLRNRGR